MTHSDPSVMDGYLRWQQIATATGMTRQSAHERWSRATRRILGPYKTGENDGIASVAAVAVRCGRGVHSRGARPHRGLAAVVGGSISMALGEYMSVSSQTDSQRALIDREWATQAADLRTHPAKLATSYGRKGLSPDTARTVAEDLAATYGIGSWPASLGVSI